MDLRPRKWGRLLTPSKKPHLAVRLTDDDDVTDDAPAVAPAPTQRRTSDAPMLPPGNTIPMCCLLCGYDVFEMRSDVCPTCTRQDCRVPSCCMLAVRCKRSGRDTLNVPIHTASTQEVISARLATTAKLKAVQTSEHTCLSDPRDTQGEGPQTR